MNIIKDLFIGLLLVGSSAQSTTSYAIPLVINGATQGAMLVASAEVFETIAEDNSLDAVVKADGETQTDFVSLITITQLDENQPYALRKEYVETFFEGYPDLARIAFCESAYRHNTPEGDVLRGYVDKRDVGIMQINEHYHGQTAEELGYDIYTIRGNLAYARYLYEKQGSRPWNASKACWAGQS